MNYTNSEPRKGDNIVNLYYLRHFSELNEAAKKKLPKEMDIPVAILITVGALLAAPFIMVGGFIFMTTWGVTNKISAAINHEKDYAEIDDAEFDATVKELEELQQKFLKLQKSSKYYNLVYRYHGIDTFTDIKSNNHHTINIREEFRKGKIVRPALVIIYYLESGIGEYKNLLKTFPFQDIPYYQGENEDYLMRAEDDIIKDAIRHLNVIDPQMEKYPHCNITYTSKGDGTWILIDRKGKRDVKRKIGGVK